MTRNVQFSIRLKILLVLSVVLCSAVGLYLFLASKIFYEDKTLLVYELTQTNVRTLGEETDVYLNRILDKMKLLSYAGVKDTAAMKPLLDLLLTEKEGVWRVGMISRKSDGTFETSVLGESLEALKVAGKGAQWLDEIRLKTPVPFEEVLKNGVWVKNVTIPAESNAETLPVMTLAVRTADGTQQVIYADVSLERLLESVTQKGISKVFIADTQGNILADTDPQKVSSRESVAENPLIQGANASKLRSEVRQFSLGDKKYLGSFYRLSTSGLIAASQVEMEAAFMAAQVLMRKSLIYALIVVTAAFLVSLLLSHSITSPIQKMVEATQSVAHGDFSVRVPVTTRDELAILTRSFNSMTGDLGQTLETLKSTQNQLIESERMAAIGQIARSIGHEFGNILLAIVGNADLATLSNDREKIQNNLKTILQAAERASFIVRNLQSFSKTESVHAPADPAALIRATLTLLHHETQKNSIEVSEKCEPCRKVTVNAAEIEQVLMNFVINSMHAMPNGGQVEVGCKNAEDDKVLIWVKDTGTGIPAEVLPRIFDFAFTTKGEKGSGLGLAISKQIIEGHQGTLGVKTKMGEGTVFEILLVGSTA